MTTEGETDLHAEYVEERDRLRLMAQLDHIVYALELDEQLDVPGSLGVAAESCGGEALWCAIANQPLILTRLTRMVLGLLDSYLHAADVQTHLNEQGRLRDERARALASDLSIITDALAEAESIEDALCITPPAQSCHSRNKVSHR
jgi:hypothetical protein